MRLVDSDSILNVPFNLFQDIVNIPYSELGDNGAVNDLGTALLFSGTWLTASATNIWGEDPGDRSHFAALTDMFLPFPELTGQCTPKSERRVGFSRCLGSGERHLAVGPADHLVPGCRDPGERIQ